MPRNEQEYKKFVAPFLKSSPPSCPVFCCRSFYSTNRRSFLSVRKGGEWRERRGRKFSKVGDKELERKLEIGLLRELEEGAKKRTKDVQGGEKSEVQEDSVDLDDSSSPTSVDSVSAHNSSLLSSLRSSLSSLNLSHQALSLPERSSETSKIHGFLSDAIKAGGKSNSAMFVAGPPGSGKTATVESVVRKLERDRGNGNIPDFR